MEFEITRTVLVLLLGLCFLQQGTQRIYRDTERASGESIHVSGVDTDNFALRVKYGAAAAAVSGGRIVDELVADHVAEMSASRRGTNQRQGCEFAGRADVIVA